MNNLEKKLKSLDLANTLDNLGIKVKLKVDRRGYYLTAWGSKEFVKEEVISGRLKEYKGRLEFRKRFNSRNRLNVYTDKNKFRKGHDRSILIKEFIKKIA